MWTMKIRLTIFLMKDNKIGAIRSETSINRTQVLVVRSPNAQGTGVSESVIVSRESLSLSSSTGCTFLGKSRSRLYL